MVMPPAPPSLPYTYMKRGRRDFKVPPWKAEIAHVIGTLVGGYRVVTELGAGPSGSVYYAEHPVIGRRAAIKVLSPELSAARERLDAYITHLKVVSNIRHPNIVDVLDIGQMPRPIQGTLPSGPAT